MTAVRVGMVVPRFPPAVGGVEQHAAMLAHGAADAGLDVEVLTTDPSGLLSRDETTRGVRIRRFGTLPGGDVFFLSPRLAGWLWRHAGRYDVIHAHSYHAPLAVVAALAARRHRVPFVVTPHYHGGGHTSARDRLHAVYRPFGAWMLRQASRVVCNSRAERDHLIADAGRSLRTVIVPPGVEVDRIRAARPFETPSDIVLTGGRLETYKQVELVVRALAHLPAAFRLVVFGDGPARGGIETTADDAGVRDRVELVGRIPEDVLDRWFRTARVFASLSRHESFGLTIVEAAAGGASVVASDIPAYRELVERLGPDHARAVPPDATPETVAAAIQAAAVAAPAASEPDLPRWSSTIDGYVGLYEAVGAARTVPVLEAAS